MRPTFKLKLNDEVITSQIADRLLSLTISDEAGVHSDSLELELDDRDNRLPVLKQGHELVCELGYHETGTFQMGRYVVDQVDLKGPPDTMIIQAKAANVSEEDSAKKGLSNGLKAQKRRSWHEQRILDMVSKIATENGYAAVVDSSIGSVFIEHIDQTDESDMNFLTRLAVLYDGVFKPFASRLFFLRRAGGHVNKTILPLSRSQVTEWELAIIGRSAFERVRTYFYDHGLGQLQPVDAGTGDPLQIVKDPFPNRDEATRVALAEYQKLQRARSTGRLTLPGNPQYLSELFVDLSGFRPEFNGVWSIQRATHTLNSSGYVTELDLETPRES